MTARGSLLWLWLLVAAAVMNQVTIHLIRPTTTYKLIALEAGSFTIGAVTAVYAVLPLLCALWLGGAAQRFASLKPMLVGGSLLCTVGAALVAWAETVLMISLASAVMGLGQLAFTIAGQSAIARFAENRQLDMAFGWFTAGFSAGQMIGPLIGGVMLNTTAMAAENGATDGAASMPAIDTTLWVGAVISIPAILILQLSGKRYRRRRKDEQQTENQAGAQQTDEDSQSQRPAEDQRRGQSAEASEKENTKPTVLQILKRPGVPSHMFTAIALISILDVLSAFLPLVGTHLGVAPIWVGVLLAVRGLASIVSRLLLPVLRRHFSREALVLWCLWTSAITLSVPPFVLDNLWIAIPTMAVAGFFLGVGQPLTMTMVTQAVPDNWRSQTLALRLMGNRVGQVAVPLVAGAVAAPLGPGGAIWFTCAILALSGTERMVFRRGRAR